MDRLISAEHFSKRLVQASKYWNTDKADSHDKGVAQGLLEADEKLVDESTIQAIPLDKVKQAREEISKLKHKNTDVEGYRWWNTAIENCLHGLDKLIAESEE